MVKERVPKKTKVDISDLAKEWDSAEVIREYLRADSTRVLFDENISICIKHVGHAHVHAVLKPILLRTAGVELHPQPPVRQLRHQIGLLYQKAGRTTVDEKAIIDDSWYIRKFLALVKMKTRKRLVSTAPHLNQYI